jgi:uncharacterized membrane protein
MLREHVHHHHTGVPRGFRARGKDVTRLEGFSDAVFAFAVTLLVVSLEVPHTFRELMDTMKGFIAFAVCFAILMQIWAKHCGFFRRYGLQDATTRTLNAVLLFIVLFYVYPLKYLWGHLVTGSSGFEPDEGRTLLEIYGLGGAAVFTIFVLLYYRAWRLRDMLELNELERFDTRAAIRENLWMAAVPAASAVLAATLPSNLIGLAGLFYAIYGPLLTWNGMREGKRRRPIEEAVMRENVAATP